MKNLTEFWFSEDYQSFWFNASASDDEQIKEKFEYLFEKYGEIEIDYTNLTQFHPKTYLGLILLHDQISRHCFRNNDDKVNKLREISLKIADNIVYYSSPRADCNSSDWILFRNHSQHGYRVAICDHDDSYQEHADRHPLSFPHSRVGMRRLHRQHRVLES